MTKTSFLATKTPKETVWYSNGGKSDFYVVDSNVFIIDSGICLSNPKKLIDYSLITDRQNAYMNEYKSVYRFLKEDENKIQDYLSENAEKKSANEESAVLKPTANRENSADSSPLEFYFEKEFSNVYGSESLKYLNKEYGISDSNGNTFYLDYLVHTQAGDIAVEENGINYHHPQIIGKEKYRHQLFKQNECAKWGIKLYRFSTEDCRFEQRIQDDIKRFFGSDTSGFKENGILASRKIKLYEHQKITLRDIQESRKKGISTFLIVLPTAAGKSKIIEEDIKSFSQNKKNFKALILAPNKNIIADWQKRIKDFLPDLAEKISIKTYSFLARNYKNFSPEEFSYIVADEAHHTVAPTYKRIIQYFSPDFLIGLTATDQRPDKQKLESIFGSYKTQLSLAEAMKKKIVAQANVYRIETNIDLSHIRFNGKDYVNADLEKSVRVSSRNNLIADILKKYFSTGKFQNEQGLIFCVNTEHSKEMAKILNSYGITAASYTSRDKGNEKTLQDFNSKKIRFLCTCNMISEGWDYPALKIIVMARPTLSKVLYLQQIGRGLRKTSTKENVFIIDVVDEYGALIKPCTMHSIFKNPAYVPFGLITKTDYKTGDIIQIDGLSEEIQKITKINIEDFSEKYKDFLSVEQLAREFFVSTDTVTSWIKKKEITPDAAFDFGTKKIYMFSPENAKKIKIEKNIANHDETTIHKDFFDFLDEGDYTFSYKMPFLLSLLKNSNEIGEAKIDSVLKDYVSFYQNRILRNLPVDKKNCPYTKNYLSDTKSIKENMLKNPFEKFERKRFMYISKDLGIMAFNSSLWDSFSKNDFEKIKMQLLEDLRNYYKNLGGIFENDNLVAFAKGELYSYQNKNDENFLKVAENSKYNLEKKMSTNENYTQKTLEYYEANSDNFINGTLNVEFSKTQDFFLSYLKAGAEILDFGCGSGRDTKYFLSRGFKVDAIDGSKKMCEYASSLCNIKVQTVDFLDFSPSKTYDGIWACSSILHLNTADLAKVIKKISKALNFDGIFYTSFKYSNFEGFRNGRFFNDMTEEKFTSLIKNFPELKIISQWISQDARPNRKNEKWLNIICKKN